MNVVQRFKRDSSDDAGVGLIELIVVIVLTGILSGVIVMIMVNSWRTQEDVTTTSDATNKGQFVASTIERAVRNALAVDVSTDGTTLMVRTSLTGPLACQGFAFAGGESLIRTSTGPLDASTSWATWKDDIVQRAGTPFFQADGDTVTYTFDISTESAPTQFTGEVSARSTQGVSSPCW